MAYRNKAKAILKYAPDIVIVPECECKEKLIFPPRVPKPNDMLWFGSNPHKGLGIFSYSRFTLRQLDAYNPEFKLVVPVEVTDGEQTLLIYAIWANNPQDPEGPYVTQVWKAIKYYDEHLKPTQTILLGDFNSNTIWDKPRREGNHSTLVKLLEQKDIHSVYHHHFKQEQGKELHPTLYLHRNKLKPYHIDYCFASGDLISRLRSVEIGNHRKWCKWSDHVPVVVQFDV